MLLGSQGGFLKKRGRVLKTRGMFLKKGFLVRWWLLEKVRRVLENFVVASKGFDTPPTARSACP